jgi:hypothetical protein
MIPSCERNARQRFAHTAGRDTGVRTNQYSTREGFCGYGNTPCLQIDALNFLEPPLSSTFNSHLSSSTGNQGFKGYGITPCLQIGPLGFFGLHLSSSFNSHLSGSTGIKGFKGYGITLSYKIDSKSEVCIPSADSLVSYLLKVCSFASSIPGSILAQAKYRCRSLSSFYGEGHPRTHKTPDSLVIPILVSAWVGSQCRLLSSIYGEGCPRTHKTPQSRLVPLFLLIPVPAAARGDPSCMPL